MDFQWSPDGLSKVNQQDKGLKICFEPTQEEN